MRRVLFVPVAAIAAAVACSGGESPQNDHSKSGAGASGETANSASGMGGDSGSSGKSGGGSSNRGSGGTNAAGRASGGSSGSGQGGKTTDCAESCDDGFSCTVDACTAGECTHTIARAENACSVGKYCTTDKGCVQAPACATTKDCVDAWAGDPCKTNIACDPASSACLFDLLDKDGDGHAPLVCGGDDCDDSDDDLNPDSAEICDSIDNDCNGSIDDGAGCPTTCTEKDIGTSGCPRVLATLSDGAALLRSMSIDDGILSWLGEADGNGSWELWSCGLSACEPTLLADGAAESLPLGWDYRLSESFLAGHTQDKVCSCTLPDCDDAGCVTVPLEGDIDRFVVSGSTVYMSDKGSYSVTTCTLPACDDAAPVYEAQDAILDIAVGGGKLYVSVAGDYYDDDRPGAIVKCTLPACDDAHAVRAGDSYQSTFGMLAARDDFLMYGYASSGTGTVGGCLGEACVSAPTTSTGPAREMATDGAHGYWLLGDSFAFDGRVMTFCDDARACPDGSRVVIEQYESERVPQSLVAGDGYAVWSFGMKLFAYEAPR